MDESTYSDLIISTGTQPFVSVFKRSLNVTFMTTHIYYVYDG